MEGQTKPARLHLIPLAQTSNKLLDLNHQTDFYKVGQNFMGYWVRIVTYSVLVTNVF